MDIGKELNEAVEMTKEYLNEVEDVIAKDYYVAIQTLLSHCEKGVGIDEDILFLLERANHASSISFWDNEREAGTSSNAIVRLAYGGKTPNESELPSDQSDLNACERMWKKLPKHRKTKQVIKAMEKARKIIKKSG